MTVYSPMEYNVRVSFCIRARHDVSKVSQTPMLHYLFQIPVHAQNFPDFNVAFFVLQRYSTNLSKNGHFKDKQFLFAGFLQCSSFGIV